MMRVYQPWFLFVTCLMVFLSVTSGTAGRTTWIKKPDAPSRIDDEKIALLIHHGLIPFTGWRWWGLGLGLPWGLGLGGFPWGRRGFFGGRRGFLGGRGGFLGGRGDFPGRFGGFPGGRGGFPGTASYAGKAEVKSKDEARRNPSP